MSELKVGKYAVCVDAGDWCIAKGRSYLVLGFRDGMVKVLVDGAEKEYFTRRFKPIEKPKDNTPKYSTPNGKHKHHDVIVAWANGAVVERKINLGEWHRVENPSFGIDYEYRIKPEKSKAAIAAEKQLDDAEKALFEVEKAVKAAKQALLEAQEA